VLLDLCDEMDELAPEALLLNYVNPMAANCWAVCEATERPIVGLCHSVQGTSEMLASWIGVPYEQVNFLCAGINHQAWFLEFNRGKEDLYPLLWQAIEKPDVYGQEPVRIDLMKYFGYFVTESSGHASEYLPYFRKSAKMVEEELVPKFSEPINFWFKFGATGGYLQFCQERLIEAQKEYAALLAGTGELVSERSHEYGVRIIEAIETGVPVSVNGNVPNYDLIDNLPYGCCVEVPCLVNGAGLQPTRVGGLPAQLAAINRTNVNVQDLIVEAALSGETEAVFHAVMLDPLTSAVCTLPQIHAMVTEMLEAQKHWLPQFDL